MLIKDVSARIINDSRGESTIEVSVNGAEPASSPSGKSTGKYETKPYYRDLKFCVSFLNEWGDRTQLMKFEGLVIIEDLIRKKLNLKEARLFGGNALFAFESAILKALAREQKKELWEIVNPHATKFPRPVGNVIGGGLHTKGKIKPVFQEFLLIPREKTFSDNVNVMKKTFRPDPPSTIDVIFQVGALDTPVKIVTEDFKEELKGGQGSSFEINQEAQVVDLDPKTWEMITSTRDQFLAQLKKQIPELS